MTPFNTCNIDQKAINGLKNNIILNQNKCVFHVSGNKKRNFRLIWGLKIFEKVINRTC